MSTRRLRSTALAAAVLAMGCTSAELLPARIRVRGGPAARESVTRVVALRSTCGSLSTFGDRQPPGVPTSPTSRDDHAPGCPERQLDGVDQLVRARLEFRGYQVIDSERVNATTLSRLEEIEHSEDQHSGGGPARSHRSSTRTAEVTGSRFADATPAQQDAILAELGAEGLFDARIWIGAGEGTSQRRNIDVQVRLLHVASGKLVWASRCRIEAGMVLNSEPIMEAARCAIEKAMEYTGGVP